MKFPDRSGVGGPLVNALLFQFGWLACVVGGDRVAVPVAAAVLLLHWRYLSRDAAEWFCMALSVALGVAIDAGLEAFDVLQFVGGGVPVWLIALWALFATTLNHSLRVFQRHLLWAALAGAGAGPLSYWSGVRLDAARFGIDTPTACAVLGVCWSLLLPLLSAMMRRRYRVLSLCMSSSKQG
jgi:hypothetical protein